MVNHRYMKKLLTAICLLLTFAASTFAQTPPEAFSYSAVARDANSNPIANSTIGIQISLRQGSPLGIIEYQENHFVNTDQYGLFNLTVGGGSVQSGVMASIDWAAANYFLQVGMDANGGTNFLNMGTTQLLSVPYALHAKTAGSIVGGGGGGGGGFTHYIGEEFGGGVIFHLWKDNAGMEHGLIVDKTDLSTAQAWSNVSNVPIGFSAQSSWDGLGNSNGIVGQAGHSGSAALLCLINTNGGQSDWYLPSIDELSLLWHNRFNVNKSLSNIGGANLLPTSAIYWSSTESSDTNAWNFSFITGSALNPSKTTARSVRAIRTF